jgi:hypothetical protein
LGASNDSDLAAKLGLTRFAISRWKARGVIPPKYRFLIERDGGNVVDYGVQFIVHDRVYAHADHHYWLRAALLFLPTEYGADLPEGERARLLEFVLTRLMGAAVDATSRELGKPRCEGEGDFQQLIDVLKSKYSDRIQRVLSEGRTAETPQSIPQSTV